MCNVLLKSFSSFMSVCIVGLFPSNGSVEQMAFELAIHKVNLDPTLSNDVKLEARVKIIDSNDCYRTSQTGKIISTGTLKSTP